MPPDPPPLTAEQTVERDWLYRHLLDLRASGVRMVTVTLQDALAVGTVSRKVDFRTNSAKIVSAS